MQVNAMRYKSWLIVILIAITAAIVIVVRPWTNEAQNKNLNKGPSPKSSLGLTATTSNDQEQSEAISAGVIRNNDQRWHTLDDPSRDGWSTEAFNLQAGKQLKKIGHLLAKKKAITPESIAPMVTKDFSGTAISPHNLQTVHEDGVFLVQRMIDQKEEKRLLITSDEDDKIYKGAAGFAQALEELSLLFRDTKDIHYKVKIIDVRKTETSVTTKQYFSCSGQTTNGMLEMHATWVILWQPIPSDQLPKIKSISLEDMELVRSNGQNGAFFSDCTASIFHGNKSYEKQLLKGMNHWLQRSTAMRSDRRDGGYDFGINTPGIALGDVNGDGLEDLYLCQENGLPNLLFIHNPDGTVTDVSQDWGVDWLHDSRSALFLDWDNDGDQDLAFAIRGGVVLAENIDQKCFQYKSLIETSNDNMSLSAADYDLDGDLDIYVCTYNRNPFFEPLSSEELLDHEDIFIPHDANNGGTNRLLRNDGDAKFIDATKSVGLDVNNHRYSFSSSWEDYDNDGDPDLYVANDFGRDNLYRNDGGIFHDISEEAQVENSASGMGVAWGDYDRDGWMDSYVSNMWSSAGRRVTQQPQFKVNDTKVKKRLQRFARGNTLLQNLGNGTFKDRSGPLGVEMGRWAWSNQFVDLNNDSWEDLVVANGYLTGTDDSGDL